MDSDSDTAFNNYENFNGSFYDVLIKTKSGKCSFKRFLLCVFFALCTIVCALVPGLNYSLEFVLKALFCLLAMLTAYNVYLSGIKAAFKRKPTTDLLSTVCTLVSYVYAIITGFHWFENGVILDNDFCFIIIVTVLTGVLFGDFVKNGLKNRSNDAVERLCEFIPENIEVFRDGQSVSIEFEYVRSGDCAKVMPGDKIPFDAVVQSGETMVDESPLTGKITPVKKELGSKVFAGSINKYGEIIIKSTCSGDECLISRLIRIAKNELEFEEERNGLTERIISFYLPFVVFFALIVALGTKIIGFTVYDAIASGSVVFGLTCPVALAFVEPLLTLVFVSKAYKSNILIQNPNVVSTLNEVNAFVFDKNGTLIDGEYELSDIIVFKGFSEEKIIEYAASIESVSNHPICDAIFNYAYDKGIQAKKLEILETADSSYIKAKIDGEEICFGNYLEFKEIKIDGKIYEKLKNENKIVTVITVNSVAAAVIAAKAGYKPGAEKVMSYLKNTNIKTHMLSENDKSSLSLPDEKTEKIKSLKKSGDCVAMIGDGINDTVALILADVGVSVGNATPAALEASDIILASDDISDILKVMEFSKLYKKMAKQNIILSIVFNFILLVISLFMEFYGMIELSGPVLLTAFISVVLVLLNTFSIKNK